MLYKYVHRINPKYLIISVATEGKYMYLNFLRYRSLYVFHSLPKQSHNYIKRLTKSTLTRLAFTKQVYILPISKSVAKNIRDVWKINSKQILNVVYTTKGDISKNLTNFIAQRDKEISQLVIGSVGQASDKKRIEIFIQVAESLLKKNSLGKMIFYWAGTSNEIEKYRRRIKALGLESSVKLLGQVNDLEALYSDLDIYFHPSDDENMSLAVVEAMKYGKAILAMDIAPMKEIITPELNGILAVPNDVFDIENKLEKLISNALLREKFGMNSSKFYKENFAQSIWEEKMIKTHRFMLDL